jgi:hypothetical protein
MKRIKVKPVKGLKVHLYPGQFQNFKKQSEVKNFFIEIEKKYNQEYQHLNFIAKEVYSLYRDMYFNLSKYECVQLCESLAMFDKSMYQVLSISENYYIGFHLSRSRTYLNDVCGMINNSIIKIPIASLKYRIEYLLSQVEQSETDTKKLSFSNLKKVS